MNEQLDERQQIGAQAVGILMALVSGKSAVLSKTDHPVTRRQVQDLLKRWQATFPKVE